MKILVLAKGFGNFFLCYPTKAAMLKGILLVLACFHVLLVMSNLQPKNENSNNYEGEKSTGNEDMATSSTTMRPTHLLFRSKKAGLIWRKAHTKHEVVVLIRLWTLNEILVVPTSTT